MLFFFQYNCKCSSGHWHANGGGWIGKSTLSKSGHMKCTPCGLGSNPVACLADAYRASLLAANLAGMLLCLVVGLIIFRKRKCKVS